MGELKGRDKKCITAADKVVVALQAELPQAKALHRQMLDVAAQTRTSAKVVQKKARDSRKRIGEAEKYVWLVTDKLEKT